MFPKFPKNLKLKKNKFRKINRKGIYAKNITKLIRVSQNIKITSKKTALFGISKLIKQKKYNIKNIKNISLIGKKREKKSNLKDIVKCRHHFINDISIKAIIRLKKKGIKLKKISRLRNALKEKITYN